MTLEELEKRLQASEDIEAVKQVQYAYINRLTLGDWDGVTACFTEDAVIDLGEGSQEGRVTSGKADIDRLFKEQICKIHVGKEGLFVVHPVITVDGDRAKGTWMSYFMHVRSRGEDPVLHWMQGIYNNEYARENGEWKISLLRWRSRLKYRESQMMVIP